MSANAPRSIDEYLKQLRQALEGQDPALIQDALYDAEEYLRAEVAAHPDKSESDVLELIASTYGAPDEVAAAYRDTEAKVKAALKTPAPRAGRERVRPGALFRGVPGPAGLHLSLLYAADPRDGHRVLHLRGHRAVPLGRVRGPHHRRAVLPGLHRHRARDCTRRGQTPRGDDRRAQCRDGRCIPGRRRAGGNASGRCSPTCVPGRRCCTCSSCCRWGSSTSPSPSPHLRSACVSHSRLWWC